MTKVIRLTGGLGNQLFQYAFSKQLQDEVFFDLSGYETDDKRRYELGHFCCRVKAASPELLEGFEDRYVRRRIPKLLRQALGLSKYVVHTSRVREKSSLVYDPELARREGDCYYLGFFQSEKYFCAYRQELLRDFSLRDELDEANLKILRQIRSCNSVSLHVRRGDYVALADIYGLCDVQYYRRAAAYVAGAVKDPVFFVFSDDIPWAKENLKLDYPLVFVDVNDDSRAHFDLELLKNCRHNVIANSSFSWWGAWLNENPEKIVVAPKVWLKAYAHEKSDTVPDAWVRL